MKNLYIALGLLMLGLVCTWFFTVRMNEDHYRRTRERPVLPLGWLVSRLPYRIYKPVMVLIGLAIIAMGVAGLIAWFSGDRT